jgi:hypothetical protein
LERLLARFPALARLKDPQRDVEIHAEQHVIVGPPEPDFRVVAMGKIRPELRARVEQARLRPPRWGRAPLPRGRLAESRPVVSLPWPWEPREERELIVLMAQAPEEHRERLTRIRTAPAKGPGSLPLALLDAQGRLLSAHGWRVEDSRAYFGGVAWLGVRLGRS